MAAKKSRAKAQATTTTETAEPTTATEETPMADENNPTNKTDADMTPEDWARHAQRAAEESAANAQRAEDAAARIEKALAGARTGGEAPAAVRPARQGVPTSLPVGSRSPVVKGDEETEYTQRREMDDNTRRRCVCGAPLYAHVEAKPWGCPETDCPEFSLAR